MDKTFYESVEKELFGNILPYWCNYSRDFKNPGFYGDIDKYEQFEEDNNSENANAEDLKPITKSMII